MYFPDEGRYTQSGKALKSLTENKFDNAITYIFSVQGRPMATILYLIPSALQYLTSDSTESSEIYRPTNSYWLFYLNFFLYILTLIFLFKISKIILSDVTLSLLVVFFYSTLDSSFMFLRHALSYDASLLILLYTNYCILQINTSNKSAFKLGIFNSLGFLMYPGYVLFFVFNIITHIFLTYQKNKFLKKNTLFAIGVILTFLSFEGISRLGEISLFQSSLTLSKTIKLGDFQESLIFVFKFLFEVEGIKGILPILSLCVFPIIYIFVKSKTKSRHENNLIYFYYAIFVFLYLIYGLNGYILKQSAYYGRIIHQFIPFIIIFTAYVLHIIFSKLDVKYYQLILGSISIFLSIVFVLTINEFKRIEYPKDIEYQIDPKIKIFKQYEYSDVFYIIKNKKIEYNNRDTLNIECQNQENLEKTQYYLTLNQSFYFPIDSLSLYRKFNPKNKLTLLFDVPHPVNYIGYQYEGHSIKSRKLIDSLKLRMQVFKHNP